MKYVILGEELSLEFAEVIYNLNDIDELVVLGEIVDKSILHAFLDIDIKYLKSSYGDGLGCINLNSLSEYTIVSCISYAELFVKFNDYLVSDINFRKLNPDTGKIVTIESYLLKQESCDHAMVRVVTNRSVYDCLGIAREDIKAIINSRVDEIDVESSNNDVVYFKFINSNLVPANRGIVVSGNPGYTHMCGLGTESFKCIDRRFLRCEHTNISKALINCNVDIEFTLSASNYSNLLIDDTLLGDSTSSIDLSLLIESLKLYLLSDRVGYIYLKSLNDLNIEKLCSIGIPIEKIKEWR